MIYSEVPGIIIKQVSSLNTPYYGKFIGKLSELNHGVSGEVYAVDGRTIHLKDFTYDGEGPAAYFYVGNTKEPSGNGIRLRDERGSSGVIKRYRKKSITLTLPDGKTLNNIKWFSVWCDEFSVNFGDVKIPRNFDFPRPQKIDALNGVHKITSDNIVIVDAQTLLIPNLSYDGEAPDAKFWVGRGPKPSPQGIRVPDENGKMEPLRQYHRKTVVLTLPGDLTVFDIGHFGIWCEAFTVDFGHVRIPSNLNVPPSLKMLGVSPQSKLNCEVLNDDLAFEVRWAVAGDSIVIQLVSKLEDNEYMSFGLSGDDNHSVMVKGDVVVAWVDKETLKGYAEDYYLDAKSQCSGNHGSCPDERLQDKTNNIRLLNAAMVNGYSIVTYQRALKPSDKFDRQIYNNRSQAIIWAIGPLNQRNEVSFHSQYLKNDQFINFGRQPKWNCPMPESDKSSYPSTTTTLSPFIDIAPTSPRISQRGGNRFVEVSSRSGGGIDRSSSSERSVERNTPSRGSSRSRQRTGESRNHISRTNVTTTTTTTPRPVPTPKPVRGVKPWVIPPIECDEPDDGVFYAQMGLTGGKQGYPAITGHVGWGISWYINGLLIPEINVVRGKTYSFVTEAGLDPEIPARYHPFYITDDPVGGYQYKTDEEKAKVQIFAGVTQTPTGEIVPTGVGRFCIWETKPDVEIDPDSFSSFGEYQRYLQLRCDPGIPGVITWTPDANTPDTVYYQCFTHRYLGWKINVLNSCDVRADASEYQPAYVSSHPLVDTVDSSDDFKASASINVETRIKPSENLFLGNNMNNLYHNTDIFRKNSLFNNRGNSYYHFSSPSTTHHSPLTLTSLQSSNFKPSPQIMTSLLQPAIVAIDDSTTFKNSAINIITLPPPTTINTTTVTSTSTITTTISPPTVKPLDETTTFVADVTTESIDSYTTDSSVVTTDVTPADTTEVNDSEPAESQNLSNRLIQELPASLPHALPLTGAMYPPKINTTYYFNNKSPLKPPPLPMNHLKMGPRFGISHRPYHRPLYPNFAMKKPYFRPKQHRPIQQMSTILRPVIHPPPKTLHPKPIMMLIPNKPHHHFHRGDLPFMFPPPNKTTNNIEIAALKPPSNNQTPFTPPALPALNIQTLPLIPPALPAPKNHTPLILPTPQLTFTNESSKKIIPLSVDVVQDFRKLNNRTQNLRVTTPTHIKKIIHNTTIKPIPSKMISIKPDFRHKLITSTLEPAINTGFRPDSIIIEGGFKPIITKIAQDRISSDLEQISDNIGVIDLSNQETHNDFTSSQQSTETFEPMFIPSPPDSRHQQQQSVQIVDETQNSIPENFDEMVMAAERIDSFYLPPPTVHLKTKQHQQQQKPDLSVPNGSIVTYDGQLLSDISLSPPLPAFPSSTSQNAGLSKIEQLVRNTPQFVPFKGELPPSVPDIIQIDSLPQLKSNTKLIKSSPRRKRRSPHHTPEHKVETATPNRSTTLLVSTNSILFMGLVISVWFR
ncbi:protein Skeletor, isoforms D/E-like [Chrysoperla carnea]|uniref:protein Skeletor, isoforms D/E-like n=1 Tax=Chrysoperla carnea TaxID=189513 RepID=UPI001D071D42|nr:protein Skeletor, isoforms D/E-like [Chrysoperla carnea]